MDSKIKFRSIYIKNIMNNLNYCCINCGKNFQISESKLNKITNKSKKPPKYCSFKCFTTHKTKVGTVKIKCTNCNKEVIKIIAEINKSKSGNHFCSKSCSVTYNNTHKTKGNRRSKLEKYLENQLKLLYPDLEILFNNKTVINSELDIYIPSLKLAFELNGIFHYEPIFGNDKLNQIQNNDNRKFQACLEQGIELCIIDTSKTKYLKKKIANNYLNIVTTIINQKSN